MNRFKALSPLFGLLLWVGALTTAWAGAPERALALQAEMRQLQRTHPTAAVAKGKEALALLAASPDLKLELELLEAVIHLQIGEGDLPGATQGVERGESLATSTRDKAAQRLFLSLRAEVFLAKGNYAEAGRLAEQAMRLARDAKDQRVLLGSLNSLSFCRAISGDLLSAFQYLHEALEIAEQLNDSERQVALLSTLSTFYLRTREWPKAQEANDRAIALSRPLGNDIGLAKILLNAAYIHSNQGHVEAEYRCLVEAESLSKKIGNPHFSAGVQNYLSDFQLRKQNYPRALIHANQSVALALKVDDKGELPIALTNRGVSLNHTGQHELGLADLERALKLHQETKSTTDEVELLKTMSEEYAFAGNFKKALEYHRVFKEKSDAIFHHERTKNVQELEARFQSEKQQREISQLKADGQRRALIRNFSIVAALLGLALTGTLLARYRLLRRSSSELQSLNDKLEALSVTDTLTGLRNRRFFLQHVDRDTGIVDRVHDLQHGTPSPESNPDLLFFIVDLDHFKSVNDTYGHLAGDLVLQQAVKRMQGVIRSVDELIRWGGEEFLLVARQTSREKGAVIAERLRAAVEAAPFELTEGRQLIRTCSIGFAAYPLWPGQPRHPNWEAVIELADQALYVAKSSGRNGWVGASGTPGATKGSTEGTSVAELRGLVETGLCEITSSVQDPAQLVWGGGSPKK